MKQRLFTIFWFPVWLSACASSQDRSQTPAAQAFGQKTLPTLTTACEGITGLTGQALLDVRVDKVTTMLAEFDVSGNPTTKASLQMDITWPAAPVATCYPPYQPNGTVIAQARVAIEGLTLKFTTADGHFRETLAAKAWLPVLMDRPQQPQLIAITTRDKIQGSWTPAPEYASANTVNFVLALAAGSTSGAAGTVGVSTAAAAELDAAIFRGSFISALWPAN